MDINEVDNYVESLLNTDRIQLFLEEHKTKLEKPLVCIVPSCGPRYAAMTYGHRLIEISSWLTVDKAATLSAIRHEMAHIITNGCKLPGTTHGQNYNKVLKCVSKRVWRKDKHWHPNVIIEKARLEIHPRAKSLLR